MGGVKSLPNYNYTPCITRSPIREEKVRIEKITRNNYEKRLSQYNLTYKEKNIIKSGLYCKSRINQRVNKFFFNNLGSGIFEMSCYTFKIVTNRENEKVLEIIKNKLRYKVKATCEKEKKGWGILFWYRTKSTENRVLTFDEIENIKNEMREKLNTKLLC